MLTELLQSWWNGNLILRFAILFLELIKKFLRGCGCYGEREKFCKKTNLLLSPVNLKVLFHYAIQHEGYFYYEYAKGRVFWKFCDSPEIYITLHSHWGPLYSKIFTEENEI